MKSKLKIIQKKNECYNTLETKESVLDQEAFKNEAELFRKGKGYNIEGSTQTKKITEAARLRK